MSLQVTFPQMYLWIHDKYCSTKDREQCFQHNNFSETIIQRLQGAVVKDPISHIGDTERWGSNSVEAIVLKSLHFFLFSFVIIFSPLACFPLFALLLLWSFARILRQRTYSILPKIIMNTAFDTVSTKPKINILLSSKVHIILHSKIK